MIRRVYLKDCLSFNEVDLEFKNGLNIFTGPSGAGKSILMQAILSLFALADVKAKLGEVELDNLKFDDESYDINSDDDIVIKSIKKDKVRYFLNNQSISKKNLNEFSKKLIKHLNLKDTSEFDSLKLIDFLDKLTSKNKKEFKDLKDSFDNLYIEFQIIKKELKKILEDENKLEDLKEFAKFEISKIEQINPSIDEYEELNLIKKRLSKKEKIETKVIEVPQEPKILMVDLSDETSKLEQLYTLVRENGGKRPLHLLIRSKLQNILIETSFGVDDSLDEKLQQVDFVEVL